MPKKTHSELLIDIVGKIKPLPDVKTLKVFETIADYIDQLENLVREIMGDEYVTESTYSVASNFGLIPKSEDEDE